MAGSLLENHRSKLVSENDLGLRYPGLQHAVIKAAEITTRHARPIRPDVDIIKPPLLLCDTGELNKLVDAATKNRAYEMLSSGSHAHFAADEGVIYGSKDELMATLQKGKSGMRRVTTIIAEEYMHAFSTVASKDAIRCGFIHISKGQTLHALQPGKIYESQIEPDEDGSEEDPVIIDSKEERLTENATILILHHLLTELLPDLDRQYPLLAFRAGESSKPIIFPKSEDVLRLVIAGLVTGNKDFLYRSYNGALLSILESPYLQIASVSKIPISESEDIYIL